MKTLLMLIRSGRVLLAELVGVIVIVIALSMLAPWAAWLAVGVALLVKALEWELESDGVDKPGGSS